MRSEKIPKDPCMAFVIPNIPRCAFSNAPKSSSNWNKSNLDAFLDLSSQISIKHFRWKQLSRTEVFLISGLVSSLVIYQTSQQQLKNTNSCWMMFGHIHTHKVNVTTQNNLPTIYLILFFSVILQLTTKRNQQPKENVAVFFCFMYNFLQNFKPNVKNKQNNTVEVEAVEINSIKEHNNRSKNNNNNVEGNREWNDTFELRYFKYHTWANLLIGKVHQLRIDHNQC